MTHAGSGGRIAAPLPEFDAALFDPLVSEYFARRFGRPTPAQRLGWPAIRSGGDVVIVAPTGSGKTLAAFLVSLDELVRVPAHRAPRIHTLYISPLRALSHDIHRSLQQPLADLQMLAAEKGRAWPGIEVGVRTADTPPARRRAMARRPPHLMVTTPESFFLMLLSPTLRPALLQVRRIIVDELHALVSTKRGAHLALTLELRDHLAGFRAQRVGLSATLRPLEAATAYLGGAHAEAVRIVDAGARRDMDLEVILPTPQLPEGPEGSIWPSVARRLLELVEAHRSTLIFVNNRRLAERLTHQLNDLAGRRVALTHHGSMARPARLYVEQALKAGELKAVVATSTLELGIDVGSIDLVVQVQSPAEVAQGLQRVGRSGHAVAATARGRIVATHPADLLQAAAAARAIASFDIEPVRPTRTPLDVLAQFVAGAATIRDWQEEELFELVRRAGPFSDLSREMLRDVVGLMAGEVEGGRFRPRIRWEPTTGRIRASEGTLTVLYANAGTIPDRGLYPVYLQGTDVKLGELDEEFTYESRRGDVFWLGMGAWRIESIKPDRVIVSPAPDPGSAKIPFWRGDVQGRSTHLGRHVGALLAELERRLDAGAGGPGGDAPEQAQAEARRWLQECCRLDEAAAAALVRYVQRQRAACGVLPTDRRVVIETFPDELGDRRIVVHSPWGRRVHRAWAMALEAYLRQLGIEADTAAADDGVMLRLPAEVPVDLDDLAVLGGRDPVELVTTQLPGTPLVAQLFREASARALFIPRSHRGRRLPLWQQRLRAADLMLLQSRQAGPGSVLLREALREAAHEALDLEQFAAVVRALQRGEMEKVVVQRRSPSPFAASLSFHFTAAYLYEPDAPKAERQAAVLMGAPEVALRDAAAAGTLHHLIDLSAFHEVANRRRFPPWLSGRPPEDADELEDWLRLAGDLSDRELDQVLGGRVPWQQWMDRLAASGRVLRRGALWIHRLLAGAVEGLDAEEPQQRVDATASLLAHHTQADPGPWRAEAVAHRYGVSLSVAEQALNVLAAQGWLVLGQLAQDEPPGYVAVPALVEARRRTLALARQKAAPLSADAFARFLLERHGLAVPSQAADVDALVAAVERLGGLTARLPDWILMLAARLGAGVEEALRRGIVSGRIGWMVEPAGERSPAAARVALFPRAGPAPALPVVPSVRPHQQHHPADLAAARQAVMALLAQGGSWFGWELARRTGLDTASTRDALMDLVRMGLVGAESLELLQASLMEGAPSSPTDMGRTVPLPSVTVGAGPAAYRRLVRHMRRSARIRARASVRPGVDASDIRFYAVPHPADEVARVEAWAQALLSRYGVVSRAVASADGCPLPWSYVAEALERMEARGEVLRGYFVEGLGGEQFARPTDVDALRRHAPGTTGGQGPGGPGEVWTCWAADPALVAGRLFPAPPWWPPGPVSGLVAGIGSNPVLLLRPASGALWYDPQSEEALRAAALQALLRLAGLAFSGRRLVIRSVQGRPVGALRAELGWLRAAGFAEGPHTLERWL